MVALAPRAPGFARLRELAASAGSAVRFVTKAAVKPHRAALANLLHMPLTVAGVACADFAAFHYIHMIGWAVTAVSLIVLEHLIADEP